MTRDSLHRKIDKLIEHFRPYDSISGRIYRLSHQERIVYESWKQEEQRWYQQFDNPSDAYESALSGNYGPELNKYLRDKIYGGVGNNNYNLNITEVIKNYESIKSIVH